jgi:uncharacterized peroxidase-related enzyme
MPYIQTIPESEAGGELAELYRRLAYPDGSVDEAFKVLSLNPRLLAADAALYDTIMYGESPLSRAEREFLALTVSRLNGCEPCLRHHSARYRALSASAASSSSADVRGGALPSERVRMFLAFATRLTREPRAVTAADIDALRRAGLEDRAILDVCNLVAYFSYANRITLGLGVSPAPEPPGMRLGQVP